MRYALLLLLLPGLASADIYVWTDEGGVTHYSSSPPPASRSKKKAEVFKTPKRAPAAQPASPQEAPAPRKAANSVELYTTSWCKICQLARDFLNARGVPYQDYDVEADPQAGARFRARGGRGVPLAVINGQTVIGFSPDIYAPLLK